MCGRAAQGGDAVRVATELLGNTRGHGHRPRRRRRQGKTANSGGGNQHQDAPYKKTKQNMAPGHSFYIWHKLPNASSTKDRTKQDNSSTSDVGRYKHTWGLITQRGSVNHPLEPGPSKHYASLMFNARVETANEKRTFSNLLAKGQSCVIPIDGFFEWKSTVEEGGAQPGVLLGNDKKTDKRKQPFYVHHRESSNEGGEGRRPLLLAGLYTAVPTGHKKQHNQNFQGVDNDAQNVSFTVEDEEYSSDEDATDNDEGFGEKGNDEEMLHTFTMFTTSACPQLKWLHSRMPLMLTNVSDALQWIQSPSYELLKHLSAKAGGWTGGAAGTKQASKLDLAWHPVTKEMNRVGYRGEDCTNPIVLEPVKKVKTLQSFFGTPGSVASDSFVSRDNSKSQKETFEAAVKKNENVVATVDSNKDKSQNEYPSNKTSKSPQSYGASVPAAATTIDMHEDAGSARKPPGNMQDQVSDPTVSTNHRSVSSNTGIVKPLPDSSSSLQLSQKAMHLKKRPKESSAVKKKRDGTASITSFFSPAKKKQK